jgi:hypothetical protein
MSADSAREGGADKTISGKMNTANPMIHFIFNFIMNSFTEQLCRDMFQNIRPL